MQRYLMVQLISSSFRYIKAEVIISVPRAVQTEFLFILKWLSQAYLPVSVIRIWKLIKHFTFKKLKR